MKVTADLTEDRAHVALRFPYDPALIEKVRLLPGRRWSKPLSAWVVPLSNDDCSLLSTRLGVTVELQPSLLSRLKEMLVAAHNSIDIKANGPSDKIKEFRFPTTQPLAHHTVALSLWSSRAQFAFFHEPRTGKTFLTLSGIQWLRDQGETRPSLVITPSSVLHVWEDQARIHQPGLKVEALTGTVAQRAEKIKRSGADILVINPEAVWRPAMKAAIESRQWACLAVDESHRFKHRSSQQTRALLKMAPKFPRRYLLSGSPHDNNPLEVWAQMAILDPAILGSYYACRDRYAVMGGYQGKQTLSYKNLGELKQRLSGHTQYVATADCWDLPPRTEEVRKLDLAGDQLVAYKGMARDLIAEIAGQEITATVLVAKLIKLRQILAGFAYDAAHVAHRLTSNAKGAALAELLEDLPKSQKVVIWGVFREELDLVGEKLSSMNIGFTRVDGGVAISQRGERVQRFNVDPGCRVFLGQPQAAGLGLDLSAASTMVFMTNDLDRSVRLQAEARIVGPNQKSKQVTYIDLVCRGTWDVSALRLLKKKGDLDEQLTPSRITELLGGVES